MSTVDTVFALIHDRLGRTLMGVFDKPERATSMFDLGMTGASLVEQLARDDDNPPSITLGFVLDIFGSALPSFPGAAGGASTAGREDSLKSVQDFLRGRLDVLGQHTDDIAALVTAQNPASIRDAGRALFARIGAADPGSGSTGPSEEGRGWLRLQPLIGDDVGTVLSLATIVNAVRGGLSSAIDVPRQIEAGLLAYFLTARGYETVDGATVVASIHLSSVASVASAAVSSDGDVPKGLDQLRGLLSKATAEHYIRDITRVIVESAYDAGRGLRRRFADIKQALPAHAPATPEKIVAKCHVWLRGFSAMAESTTMRAVEVATQGVSEFQTNPLIAAAAGAFAGTVARKLAQDSFLTTLGNQLGVAD